MEITVSVCWCQNKMFYVTALLAVIDTFCTFKIWHCKKQHMYCFLPFGFINVIFVINPCDSYSTFIGEELEYPFLLLYDRSSWSELRYFNIEPSLKIWCRRGQDFGESRILVTQEVFKGFSRRFLSFGIWKLLFASLFSPLCTIWNTVRKFL